MAAVHYNAVTVIGNHLLYVICHHIRVYIFTEYMYTFSKLHDRRILNCYSAKL